MRMSSRDDYMTVVLGGDDVAWSSYIGCMGCSRRWHSAEVMPGIDWGFNTGVLCLLRIGRRSKTDDISQCLQWPP